MFTLRAWSQGRVFSIVTRLWTGRLGFDSWQGKWRDFFSSPQRPDRLYGPRILLSNGYRGL